MRRCTASANVSASTRSGLVPASRAGISAPAAYSTRFADHGAPPTRRRICTYSIGLATRPASMFSSSHIDSTMRLCVLAVKRWRQCSDMAGMVRCPEVVQARLGGIVRLGRLVRHEQLKSVQVGPRAFNVPGVLKCFQEVVIEEEHPDVPVGDHLEHPGIAVGMGVRAHQRVVHRGKLRLGPDHPAARLGGRQHAHPMSPFRGVFSGPVQVWVKARRIRQVEPGKPECLHVVTLTRRVIKAQDPFGEFSDCYG